MKHGSSICSLGTPIDAWSMARSSVASGPIVYHAAARFVLRCNRYCRDSRELNHGRQASRSPSLTAVNRRPLPL